MALLNRIGRRRLPDAERRLHDAYLDEIAPWREGGAVERLLGFVEHARFRLVAGGPSLVQVAVGSSLLAVGSALMAIDRTPKLLRYRPPTENWLQIGISIGMLVLAVGVSLRPRIVSPAGFCWGVGPIAVCLFYTAIVYRNRVAAPDTFIRVGMIVASVAGVSAWLAIWRKRALLLYRSLDLMSVAAWLGVIGNLWWTILLGRSGDDVIAFGTLFAASGCALLGRGLRLARPSVAGSGFATATAC